MDRYCGACDPYFARRNDVTHTYEAPRCRLARPGVLRPRPWTEKERKAHAFVSEVERLLKLKDEPPKTTAEWYEELFA